MPRLSSRQIPEASVSRLPVYLRALVDLAERGMHTVSSVALADAAGVNSAKIRKDLSYLGSYGTRGVGYDVEYLLFQISRELGLTQDWSVAIIGFGNLGRALADYGGFTERGFRVVAVFDTDESKIGQMAGGIPVRHLDDLKDAAREGEIQIGMIATPASAAQEVADRLADAGVKSILNFAPAVINVPPDVSIRKVDLSIELQILSFYQQRTKALEAARRAGPIRPTGD